MRLQSLPTLLKVLTFSFLLITSAATAQSYGWTVSNGASNTDFASAVCTDPAGNIYVTGDFRETVDFDHGVGVNSFTSNGKEDVFIQKMDASSNVLWTRTFGGSRKDLVNDMAVDANGNVYITGYFRKTVDFDPTGTSHSVTAAGADIFIQKIDTDGNVVWTKTLTQNGNIEGTSINLDAAGNIYINGLFKSTVDFDPGTNIVELDCNGGTDIFIEKLDNDGNFLWVKSIGSTGYDTPKDLIVDAQGNIYSLGTFEGTVDFDPNADVVNITSQGLKDVFVQKLDSNGDLVWINAIQGTESNLGTSMALANDGSLFTVGSFSGTVDFNPDVNISNEFTSNGEKDCFIQKLDSHGQFAWTKHIGGPFSEEITAIAIDPNNNLHVIGNYLSSFPISPIITFQTVGSSDIFIADYDFDGNFVSANTYGGDFVDKGHDITIHPSGSVYMVGEYASSGIDFNPWDSVDIMNFNGVTDYFVQKLNTCFAPDVPDFTVSTTEICAGEEVTFNITSGNLNSATNWVWRQGACDGNVVVEGTSGSIIPTESGTYFLAGQGGCVTEPICQSFSIVLNEPFNIEENNLICTGEDYTFPDGTTYSNIVEPLTHTSELTAISGCDSNIVMTVNPVIINNDVFADGNVLVAYAQNAHYQWINCADQSPITKAIHSTFTPKQSGEYAVVITQNGCQRTSECLSMTIVGTQEPTWRKNIQVFPNPMNNTLNIDLGTTFKEGSATLYHVTGKKVFGQALAGQRNLSVDVNDLSQGIYYLEITKNGTPTIFKVVK